MFSSLKLTWHRASSAGAPAAVRHVTSTTPARHTAAGGEATPPAGHPASKGSADQCPVSEATRKRYLAKAPAAGVAVDPTNNMPAVALQGRADGQAADLDKQRVKSTIPKGAAGAETWEYPSPQMFWNAMVRKNKAEGASEGDMDMVVAIHNNMNESTWKDVLAWEALHASAPAPEAAAATGGAAAPGATLLRFTGRPHEHSPKATLKQLFLGCPAPFDRHDWVVGRPDGSEVRYVIDYYHDDAAVDADGKPALHDDTTVKSIKIDVRPALDGAGALFDRAVRMPWHAWLKPALAPLLGVGVHSGGEAAAAQAPYRYLPLHLPRDSPTAPRFGPAKDNLPTVLESSALGPAIAALQASLGLGADSAASSPAAPPAPGHGDDSAAPYTPAPAPAAAAALAASMGSASGGGAAMTVASLEALSKRLAGACGGCKRRVAECGSEAECGAAAMALTYCTAQVVCPSPAAAFGEALARAGAAPSAGAAGVDEAELERCFEAMAGCINAFEAGARRTMQDAPAHPEK